ncbi:hypothetical protein [Pseudomonas rhizophila]
MTYVLNIFPNWSCQLSTHDDRPQSDCFMLAVRQHGGGEGATFLPQHPELALPEAPVFGRFLTFA